MIDHTGIAVANVAGSAAFYDAALGALGLRRARLSWGIGPPRRSSSHPAYSAGSGSLLPRAFMPIAYFYC
jgi:catechol 2,3-dioxygenase-like lactoylglutathione lyase family enzyme